MTVLVADALDPAAIELLRSDPALEVVVSNPSEYLAHLDRAEALLVRSSVKVTKDVLAAASRLKVIGRAGIGVDNIDCAAATKLGVVVMNTPGGNATSVAEHTMALMLGLARPIAAANASTKAGRWEKKRFKGREVFGKTLGIVGFGSIGRQVAERAKPFGMKVCAYDPFVSSDAAVDAGVDLLDLDSLLAEADFISLHLSLTPETKGFVNSETLAKMRDGACIINCARGGLVDSAALEEALHSGKVRGAALDVFEQEPPGDSPLFAYEQVLATPHIGGSTAEAQVKVGLKIAAQVRDFLKRGVVLNAVNTVSVTADQYGRLAPYLKLAERLGSFAAQTARGRPVRIKITYAGDFGENDTRMLRNAALSGVLNCFLATKTNLINASEVARDRKIGISESRRGRAHFSDSLTIALKTEDVDRVIEGAVFPDGSPRLLSVDGIYVETPLKGSLLYVTNRDVPGVIGRVGTILGQSGINISDFSLGRSEVRSGAEPAKAVAVVHTDEPLPAAVVDKLYRMHAVMSAKAIEL